MLTQNALLDYKSVLWAYGDDQTCSKSNPLKKRNHQDGMIGIKKALTPESIRVNLIQCF